MNHNPVVWFEIYVQNMERAKTFYESVFRVTLTRLNSPAIEMWAFPADMNRGGCGGSLVCAPDVASGGSGTMVYFRCEDCAVEAARVAGAGGRIQREKISIGEYGFIALAVDTEGNLIGLHSLN